MPESDRTRAKHRGSTAQTVQPVRMTLGRALELALSRKSGASSTVTLSRNSKGETQIEVVVATSDEEGLPRTPLAAGSEAKRLYDRLCEEYPRLDGAGLVPSED